MFAEAERAQVTRFPEFPVLYPLGGYLYCELLLDEGRTEEVLDRSSRTIELEKAARRPLHTAVHHLCIGQALGVSPEALDHLNQALDGFRSAGTIHYVPRGLLARASLYRLAGDLNASQRDLEELRILTTRSGMRLYVADYHLEQARLNFATQRTEASQEYERAQKLIEDVGYGRRKPDLSELKRLLGTR